MFNMQGKHITSFSSNSIINIRDKIRFSSVYSHPSTMSDVPAILRMHRGKAAFKYPNSSFKLSVLQCLYPARLNSESYLLSHEKKHFLPLDDDIRDIRHIEDLN